MAMRRDRAQLSEPRLNAGIANAMSRCFETQAAANRTEPLLVNFLRRKQLSRPTGVRLQQSMCPNATKAWHDR